MPREPPMLRSRVTTPIAAPMSRRGTAPIEVSRVLCISRPMPIPATAVSPEASATGVSVPRSSSRAAPSRASAPPSSG